jgi:hypothetical protein
MNRESIGQSILDISNREKSAIETYYKKELLLKDDYEILTCDKTTWFSEQGYNDGFLSDKIGEKNFYKAINHFIELQDKDNKYDNLDLSYIHFPNLTFTDFDNYIAIFEGKNISTNFNRKCSIKFDNCVFHGYVNFNGYTFKQSLSFNKVVFEQSASFLNTHFKDKVIFSKATFNKEAIVV